MFHKNTPICTCCSFVVYSRYEHAPMQLTDFIIDYNLQTSQSERNHVYKTYLIKINLNVIHYWWRAIFLDLLQSRSENQHPRVWGLGTDCKWSSLSEFIDFSVVPTQFIVQLHFSKQNFFLPFISVIFGLERFKRNKWGWIAFKNVLSC